jgi:Protein of unknown function (DUF1579)
MRSRATLIHGAFMLLSCATMARAQALSAQPNPGAELKKLGVFVGRISAEGEVKPRGGKMTSASSCEWISDGFGVLCRETATVTGMGKITDVGLMSYDANTKTYVLFQVNNMGSTWLFHGTADGDTWTWTGQDTVDGKTMQVRFTVKWTSKDSYDFKNEAGPNLDSMAVMMDGKGTRTALPPAKSAPK